MIIEEEGNAMQKNNCTEICKGIIKEVKNHGIDYAPTITVEYIVNRNSYELKEILVNKPYEKIKLGFIPIGYKTKSLIEIKTGVQTIAGNEVRVKYNPNNPREAYLLDNDSKVNWY